jgi:hypothetical protein
MRSLLVSILCRLGLHSKERFVYENAELLGLRWHVERCRWCGEIFKFVELPPEHPNCLRMLGEI